MRVDPGDEIRDYRDSNSLCSLNWHDKSSAVSRERLIEVDGLVEGKLALVGSTLYGLRRVFK